MARERSSPPSACVVVIFGVVRSGRGAQVAFAVGGYITAAYWFTSSTSFANPAITIGRTLSDTFAGIAPASAPLFVLMQLLGGALGLAAAVLAPGPRRPRPGRRRRGPQPRRKTTSMTKPVVLFACVHNGGRSLAGKVLTEHYAGGAVEARSAGSEPGDSLNPGVVAVLSERGLSYRGRAPEAAHPETVEKADVVITMGCGEACPAPGPGKRLEDWQLEDPKGKDIETVRRIVDDVDARVRALVEELTAV